MRYPVYIHVGDDEHAFGAIVPDFPGCFAATDDETNLTASIQEAIELFFEGEGQTVPTPSKLGDLLGEDQYAGGAWVLIEIDTQKLDTRAKRFNASMQVSLLARIDDAAKALHMSRSAYLAMAAEEKLKESA